MVDPRKFELYLFNPDHPANQGKAKGWRDVFDIGMGDGPLLERLIREQLDQAAIEEQEPAIAEGKTFLRWELVIPEFGGPNGNVAPILTAWALDPDNDRPHLSTTYVRTG